MRPELDKLWRDILRTVPSPKRDALIKRLIRSCENQQEVYKLPTEVQQYACMLYWVNGHNKTYSLGDQVCRQDAVRYILRSRMWIVKDDKPIRTVAVAFNEEESTIRKWVSRYKDGIDATMPILNEPVLGDLTPDNPNSGKEREKLRIILEATEMDSLNRAATSWKKLSK